MIPVSRCSRRRPDRCFPGAAVLASCRWPSTPTPSCACRRKSGRGAGGASSSPIQLARALLASLQIAILVALLASLREPRRRWVWRGSARTARDRQRPVARPGGHPRHRARRRPLCARPLVSAWSARFTGLVLAHTMLALPYVVLNVGVVARRRSIPSLGLAAERTGRRTVARSSAPSPCRSITAGHRRRRRLRLRHLVRRSRARDLPRRPASKRCRSASGRKCASNIRRSSRSPRRIMIALAVARLGGSAVGHAAPAPHERARLSRHREALRRLRGALLRSISRSPPASS